MYVICVIFGRDFSLDRHFIITATNFALQVGAGIERKIIYIYNEKVHFIVSLFCREIPSTL